MTVRSPLPTPLNSSISNPSFNDLGNQTFRFVIASVDTYLLPVSERVGFLWSLALEWWIEVPLALTRPAAGASIFGAGPREMGLCVYVSSRAPMRCPVAQGWCGYSPASSASRLGQPLKQSIGKALEGLGHSVGGGITWMWVLFPASCPGTHHIPPPPLYWRRGSLLLHWRGFQSFNNFTRTSE